MKLKLGEPAPDFSLKGTDGNIYSLKNFRDKKILVIISSCNHCPYVKAYEDRMVSIQRDYADKGVALVAINSNDENSYPEDSFENMVIRAREKRFNFAYLRDADQKFASLYGPEVTPEVFLFDKARRLRYHGRIDDSKDPSQIKSHDLRRAIDALLERKEVPEPETRAFGCSIKWSVV